MTPIVFGKPDTAPRCCEFVRFRFREIRAKLNAELEKALAEPVSSEFSVWLTLGRAPSGQWQVQAQRQLPLRLIGLFAEFLRNWDGELTVR